MAMQGSGGAVAVTGGSGFLGLHIVEALARSGLNVVSLDVAPPDELARSVASAVGGDSGSGSITFRQCDLRDLDDLRAAITAGGTRDVVHAAALTNPVGRVTLAMVDVHVRATQALLEFAYAGSLRRVIVLSSAAVLRSPEAVGTLDEDYPATPVGTYAITKQAAERLVDDARTADRIDAVALRLPALYGPYERPTGSRNHMSIIHDAVRLALAGTTLAANGAGLMRDWTRADDVAEGIRLVLSAPHPAHSLYHLGVGRGLTHRETLESVRDAVPGAELRWVDRPEDANLPSSETNPRAALGIDRARSEFGFSPRFGIRDGIAGYVESLRGRAGV